MKLSKRQAAAMHGRAQQDVKKVLGDRFETIGRAATETIWTLRTSTFESAAWELTKNTARPKIQQCFTLRAHDDQPTTYVYFGRDGIDDHPRCPLVSVFVTEFPVVLDIVVYEALRSLCGPRLGELKARIDAELALASPPLFGLQKAIGTA